MNGDERINVLENFMEVICGNMEVSTGMYEVGGVVQTHIYIYIYTSFLSRLGMDSTKSWKVLRDFGSY